MTTLPNMGVILPTLGGDSGDWDDKLNAGITLIDAHDHTSGKGTQVPSAGININADLSFAGNAATALGKAAFSAVTALVSGSKTLFVSSSDNELYWRTNAGTNVKLTSGTTINTSLVGGIVGDYTAVGAEVAFNDANDRYTFKQNSATGWARLASGEVRIFETGTSESVYVGLAAPAALGASYTLTLPTALPGSTLLAQCDSSGNITFSNTVVNSVVLAVDKNVTVSGTGEFKHGDRVRNFSGTIGTSVNGTTGDATSFALGVIAFAIYVNGEAYFPLTFDVGDRIKSITVARYGVGGTADVSFIGVYKVSATQTLTSIGDTTITNAAAAWTDTTIDLTDTVLASGEAFVLRILIGVDNQLYVGNIRVTYDHP